jgi:hypothetical protein
MAKRESQPERRRAAIPARRTEKDPINEAFGVKGFYPERSQSRGGKSISVSFTLLPHHDQYLSELASKMECSRSSVIRHLLDTHRLED